jgi:hypothetical protein
MPSELKEPDKSSRRAADVINTSPLSVDPRLVQLRAGESLESPAPPVGREETAGEQEARTNYLVVRVCWLIFFSGRCQICSLIEPMDRTPLFGYRA